MQVLSVLADVAALLSFPELQVIPLWM